MASLTERNARTKIFMDIGIGDRKAGRIIFELRSDVTPKTAEKYESTPRRSSPVSLFNT
jgi:hypothetical protein